MRKRRVREWCRTVIVSGAQAVRVFRKKPPGYAFHGRLLLPGRWQPRKWTALTFGVDAPQVIARHPRHGEGFPICAISISFVE